MLFLAVMCAVRGVGLGQWVEAYVVSVGDRTKTDHRQAVAVILTQYCLPTVVSMFTCSSDFFFFNL